MLLDTVICTLLASRHPHLHFTGCFQVLIGCVAGYLVAPASTKGWKDSGLWEKIGKGVGRDMWMGFVPTWIRRRHRL